MIIANINATYFDTNLLIDALLFLLDLFLQLLQVCRIRGCPIGLENLDIPRRCQPIKRGAQHTIGAYSSVNGVIFFSGISSSSKFFLYFSQSAPVALGMLTAAGGRQFKQRQSRFKTGATEVTEFE